MFKYKIWFVPDVLQFRPDMLIGEFSRNGHGHWIVKPYRTNCDLASFIAENAIVKNALADLKTFMFHELKHAVQNPDGTLTNCNLPKGLRVSIEKV